MKKIVVGSENPVKIEAVKQAFELVWPNEDWQVEGVGVDSGVSDQPMSDQEGIQGATNRAKRSLTESDADFSVGLEGGLEQIEGKWFDCGWIVVIDKEGGLGIGSTIRMRVPEEMMDLIKQGFGLGMVDDKVFGLENSKQASGHFGIMTNDVITRTHGYRDGVVSALTAFIHPDLQY